jgi:DNA-binding LacI/PurR family transcriptional regulator
LPEKDRAAGFLRYLKHHAPEVTVTDIPFSNGTDHYAFQSFTKALENGLDVDGVFAIDGTLALGCLKAAFRQGIKVPDDLSVISVGFAYPRDVLLMEPTTFTLDPQQMAIAAVRCLFDLVDRKSGDSSEKTAPVITVPFDIDKGETL